MEKHFRWVKFMKYPNFLTLDPPLSLSIVMDPFQYELYKSLQTKSFYFTILWNFVWVVLKCGSKSQNFHFDVDGNGNSTCLSIPHIHFTLFSLKIAKVKNIGGDYKWAPTKSIISRIIGFSESHFSLNSSWDKTL